MMKTINKILIIIQRSNGDVLLASPLIEVLSTHYHGVHIDVLVNDDTVLVAERLRYVETIHTFSYTKKKAHRFLQERELIKRIYRKYDLSINLTASDRSVLYAMLASKNSVSIVEEQWQKAWWKKLFLTHSYCFDHLLPIVKQNMYALELLGIKNENICVHIDASPVAEQTVREKLTQHNITRYIIFHPSAQYQYKVYPTALRNHLLFLLNELSIPVIVTGAKSKIDMQIKSELPSLPHVYDFIGETSLDEYIALSASSEAYIGMDTLNMHIAASQDKRIFAVFGPTLLPQWSPWSHLLQRNTHVNKPIQTYGNITLFQAAMDCVACGLAGCDDKHGKSECLYQIDPKTIFNEVQKWLQR